ncbi:RICIN domain-containing protein [Microbulbifer rhizosphaerae]|uniref:pectin lyase n=1 Tax=Microbulbifer rhizosphaerae TaxID=1562603 RepID=A0A7W4WDV5_9GAMM|nr:RICIN domain-containing protein [Microbulbifer rhizosphaerae]MBB3062416.1 pectate lyase [Microbulbifer rhizosphaerae]
MNKTLSQGIRLWLAVLSALFVSLAAAQSHAANCTLAPVSGQSYNITNLGSGYNLDVADASREGGANVQQWSSNGYPNQQFLLNDLGDGYWSIIARHSGHSLDVWGWSEEDGGDVRQWEPTGRENQQWQLKQSGNGSWNIVNRHSSKSLTAESSAQGSNVYQYKDGANSLQRWYFNPVSGDCGESPDSGTTPESGTTTDIGPAIVGFGAGTTGGGVGAQVEEVRTPDELRKALCGTIEGGYCKDGTPRIIKVLGTIDFTSDPKKTEQWGEVDACHATRICSAPYKTETTLLMHSSFKHCDGKTIFTAKYDKAGLNPLLVGSNKTLIGVGNDAGIKGKGLILDNVENVIIRNLSFTDINQGLVFGGDAIRLNTSKRVVIDHNYFARIGRQMISSGHTSGVSVDEVTISWNRFDGNNVYSPNCNGKHYWNLLLQGDGNVTFANNWLHDFDGRAPKMVGNTFYHAYNNYFENSPGHAFDVGLTGDNRPISYALLEGNYFANVRYPSQWNETKSGHIYAVSMNQPREQLLEASQQCISYLNRGCAGNMIHGATSEGFAEDTRVLDKAIPLRASLPRPVSSSLVPDLVRDGAGVGKL